MHVELWVGNRNLRKTLDRFGPFLYVTATTAKDRHANNG